MKLSIILSILLGEFFVLCFLFYCLSHEVDTAIKNFDGRVYIPIYSVQFVSICKYTIFIAHISILITIINILFVCKMKNQPPIKRCFTIAQALNIIKTKKGILHFYLFLAISIISIVGFILAFLCMNDLNILEFFFYFQLSIKTIQETNYLALLAFFLYCQLPVVGSCLLVSYLCFFLKQWKR